MENLISTCYVAFVNQLEPVIYLTRPSVPEDVGWVATFETVFDAKQYIQVFYPDIQRVTVLKVRLDEVSNG